MSNLIKLFPHSLQQDEFVAALIEAFEIQVKELYEEFSTYTTNDLPDVLIDYLAFEKHVDFYDSTLSIETKKALVKESTHMHRIKGTKAAIELLVSTVFGDGKVEEWFDYDGSPYTFRVSSSNPSATTEKAVEFIKIVNSVKNRRSHLKSVSILQTEEMSLYWGGVVHEGNYEEYRQVK